MTDPQPDPVLHQIPPPLDPAGPVLNLPPDPALGPGHAMRAAEVWPLIPKHIDGAPLRRGRR